MVCKLASLEEPMTLVLFSLLLAATAVTAEGAEWNTDDLITSIKNTFDTVFEYIGDKNGCKYECRNGKKPRPKKSHIPSSNGCGSFGYKLEMHYLPAVERCCDEHDKCYDTCNKKKESCDDDFRFCLRTICERNSNMLKEANDGCKSLADGMYAGTLALGCKPYRDSQKQACECHDSGKTEL